MSGTVDDPVELDSDLEDGNVPWQPIVIDGSTGSKDAAQKPLSEKLRSEDAASQKPLSMAEKLLTLAGYKNKGAGLGKAEQGMKKPIIVRVHAHNKGLGYVKTSLRRK